MRKSIYKFVFLLLLTPLFLFAQTSQVSTDGITVSVSPKSPGPGERFVVSAESFLIDLNRAEVSWFVGNTLQARETGLKRITLTAGDVGSTMTIRVSATGEGRTVSKTVTVRPAGVDLIWQAETYTPPFYRGKALFTFGARGRIVAFPQITDRSGRTLGTNEIIFNWSRDGKMISEASGPGRNIYDFRGSLTKIETPVISVRVESADKSSSAEENISIPVKSPLSLMYENNPLLGVVFERTLEKSRFDRGEDVPVRAYPYYFSLEDFGADNLVYEWSVRGNLIGKGKSREAVFSPESEVSSLLVNLRIENPLKIFQFDNTRALVKFINNE